METIILYKNNRIDQKYELSMEELKSKYREWLGKQVKDWCYYYYDSLEDIFIGQGLDSVADDPDGKIKEALHEITKEML